MECCPACFIDYDEDVHECIECGGPLIEGSSRETFDDISEDQWVELDPISGLPYAVMVKEALVAAGIPNFIQSFFDENEYEEGFQGIPVTVLVPEEMFDQALEIQQGIAPPENDDLLINPDADDY